MKLPTLTALCAIMAGCTGAFAADLPSRKEAPPVSYIAPTPVFSWSGFYAGVNAGGFINNSTLTTAFASGSASGSGGVLAGGTFGYNWDLRNGLVVGVETDLGYRGATTFSTPFTASSKTTHGYLGTVRGRIGYSWDRFMLYATAGGAYGSTIAPGQLFIPAVGYFGVRSGNNGGMMFGWTAGVGAEYALTDSWSIKAEYLYADLGRKTLVYVDPPSGVINGQVPTNTRAHILRAGVNYHFNWGSPAAVAARY